MFILINNLGLLKMKLLIDYSLTNNFLEARNKEITSLIPLETRGIRNV